MTRREQEQALERVRRRDSLLRAAREQYDALPPDRKAAVDENYRLAQLQAADIAGRGWHDEAAAS
jgi:hypothetical protein